MLARNSVSEPNGDQLAELFQRSRERIERLITWRCRKLLGLWPLDDILNEVYLEAYDDRASLPFAPNEDIFMIWLIIRITRVRDRLRRHLAQLRQTIRLKQHGSTGPGLPYSRVPSCVRSPSSMANEHEHSHSLASSMSTLCERHQLALLRYHLDGVSLDDLAAELGKSKAATLMILQRARKTLRERSEPCTP